MAIKIYRPTSPARRNSSVNQRAEVTKQKPEKSLVEPRRANGGRNNQGKITARFRGGGNKKMYRLIDFRRDTDGVPAKVLSIEYDPNRTCFIALVQYQEAKGKVAKVIKLEAQAGRRKPAKPFRTTVVFDGGRKGVFDLSEELPTGSEYWDGKKSYILAPEGLQVGATVMSGPSVELTVGNTLPLTSIPVGMEVHNIEMKPGRGGQLVRTAGGSAAVKAKEGDYVQIDLPSGESRLVHKNCRATIGKLSNTDHQNVRIGKAGRKRHMGKRPHNRGTSMNPCDHPMGGGEGRAHGGRHPCSPTGVLSKGGKTRRKRKPSNRFIVRRRRSVRYGQLVL